MHLGVSKLTKMESVSKGIHRISRCMLNVEFVDVVLLRCRVELDADGCKQTN